MVLTLYVVSAVCGLLSLFLLYPSGPILGIVLFVIFAGIWLGVQHLGYHEFFELGRMAVRTMEQKKIIVNNVAIRRATEALSKTGDIEEIDRVLREAFEGNDFDGFELRLAPGPMARLSVKCPSALEIKWQKPSGNGSNASDEAAWTLSLDVIKQNGQNLGSFWLYRRCSDSALLVDINLLIAGFNSALAGSLERAVESLTDGLPNATDLLSEQPLIPIMTEGRVEA